MKLISIDVYPIEGKTYTAEINPVYIEGFKEYLYNEYKDKRFYEMRTCSGLVLRIDEDTYRRITGWEAI